MDAILNEKDFEEKFSDIDLYEELKAHDHQMRALIGAMQKVCDEVEKRCFEECGWWDTGKCAGGCLIEPMLKAILELRKKNGQGKIN